MGEYLAFFYGRECPVCEKVAPLLDKLEKELSVTVTRYEVWHDATNQTILAKQGEGKCSGVPFLINKKTGQYYCGIFVPYERLLEWAKV